jgi:hypothetical protein
LQDLADGAARVGREGRHNYSAIALHRDEASLKKHEAMGFHQGWGQVFDQLVEHIKATG